MKIINEKGKLFGLINIVDLIIIIALLAVIGAVGVKLLAKPVGETISPKSEMIVTMRVRGAMLYFTDEIMKIEPGEKLVAGNSYVDGEVVSIERVPYEVLTTTDDGRIVKAVDPEREDIIITVKAKENKNSPTLKIGNQDVRIGRSFIFKTQTFEISATIETVTFNG